MQVTEILFQIVDRNTGEVIECYDFTDRHPILINVSRNILKGLVKHGQEFKEKQNIIEREPQPEINVIAEAMTFGVEKIEEPVKTVET